MSKRRLLIIVGLLAVLVIGYKLYDRKKGGEEGFGGEGDAISESQEERATRARARRAQMLKAPRSKLGGVVVDADSGEPVSGAVVSLGRVSLDLGARLDPGQGRQRITATTGADGRFELGALRAGELSVTAAARGYLPTSLDGIQLGSGEERTDLELAVKRGGAELSGVITDVGGGPIFGAFVRVTRVTEATPTTLFRAPVTGFTGQDGRFSLWLQDGTYLVEAGHADYITVRRDTQMLGQARIEDFELVPGGIIEGRVLVAGTDEPVEGATVTPTPMGGRLTGAVFANGAKTDAKGKFILTGLKSGEVNLIAAARQYASQSPTTVVLGIAEHRTDVTIYVKAAYSISGFVVNRDDKKQALPRVIVAAYNIGKRTAAVTSDPSASDGFFEITGIVPGTYTLGAVTEGMLPEIASQTLDVVDKNIDGVIVELSRGYTITGRVEPPVEAYVRLEVDPDSFSILAIPRIAASQLSRTRSDANGRFELTGLASGEVTVVAEHSERGSGRTKVNVEAPGVANVVVKLETNGSIAGTVVDVSGKPVKRARVRAAGGRGRAIGFGSTFGDFNSAITGNDGKFVVRGLAAGEYRMSVRVNGQRLSWAGASEGEAGSKRQPIKLELDDSENKTNLNLIVEGLNETIGGRVLSAEGEPVADAWVKVGLIGDRGNPFERQRRANQTDDVEEIETDETLNSRLTPKLTDQDGYFRFNNLRDGEYWVSATGPQGSATATARPIKAGAEGVVLKLAAMGSVTGQVTLAGEPVQNFTLRVNGPRLVRLPVVSESGRYSVERMPAGRYEFQIQSDVGRGRKAVEIAGEPIVVDFEVEPYAEVTGRVVGVRSGEPIKGYPVVAVSEGSDTDAIGEGLVTGDIPKTDDDGKFSVSKQGIGKATILVIDPAGGGFNPVAQGAVALVAGEPVDAGTLYAIEEPAVVQSLRGKLGLTVLVAPHSKRPNAEDETPAPPGPADTDHLWVLTVEDGGAAKAAGVVVGDRITRIDDIDLATKGPYIGQLLLSDARNGVGTTRSLAIVRGTEQVAIEVTARQ